MNTFMLWMVGTKLGRTFALVSAILIGAGGARLYFRIHDYNDGYKAAMHEIAVKTKKAVEEGKNARKDVDDCFESGGDWDLYTDSCLHKR